MPYASRAQQKYFHYLESKGKLPKKTVHEFDEATDFKDLPEHVEHHAYGGMAGDPESNYDYEMGHAEEYDSAGEPHTEDELEDEHPMEYMAHGGEVDSYGKEMSHPKYAKEGVKDAKSKLSYEELVDHFKARKKMASGGMIHKSNFARALRKAY